ncbi:hypothetical protein HMPREF9004_0910 [Schaalia cardiffensis F0333]|uniref:Uncharacterized protein n=1 Tax=Schaalia cardiffensis F0333 TaxID=888050 RepID=N6X3R2_9ACTO|nr:hypothetical protein HMPREF9004_0910 [Schaalia cardiffensis F0333]
MNDKKNPITTSSAPTSLNFASHYRTSDHSVMNPCPTLKGVLNTPPISAFFFTVSKKRRSRVE